LRTKPIEGRQRDESRRKTSNDKKAKKKKTTRSPQPRPPARSPWGAHPPAAAFSQARDVAIHLQTTPRREEGDGHRLLQAPPLVWRARLRPALPDVPDEASVRATMKEAGRELAASTFWSTIAAN